MDLSESDRAQIREALIAWRAEGVAHPRIPAFDVNGDGVVDFYALDDNDDVVIVDGTLEASVYESHEP